VHFLGTCEKRTTAQCQIPIFPAVETHFFSEVAKSIDEIAPPPPHAKIAPPLPRAFATTTDKIALYDDIVNHYDLANGPAFLCHSVKFVLPPHYRPDAIGEMCIIGVDTKKLTKIKAILIVKFLTPQSLEDITMHMHCTSLEPKRGLDQSADLNILTAMKYTLPQAKPLYDIGFRVMSAADITRAILADFILFDATQVDSLDNETSQRNPFKGTIFDQCVTQLVIPKPLPILNTMAKPCVATCAQNGSKVKVLRCKDFGVEESFRKFYGHLSLPKIEFSALVSTTR